MGENPSFPALHRLRLDTKRLRYILELFRPCYGPGLNLFLATLRQIQDHLGAINDCATARGLIGRTLPGPSPERKRLDRLLNLRAKRKAAEFREYWRQTFDAAGQERRWVFYLSRNAGRKRATGTG